MIFCVEVLAIYELPGTTPSNPRKNQRDSDFNAAINTSDKYQPGGVSPQDEYMRKIDPPSRYGFGWQCRQFVTVQSTASNLGNAVFAQLATRGLQAGSKVLVFTDMRDDGQSDTTGDPVFARYWPRANPPLPDIG